MDELKKTVEEFIDSRIKNPYFAAVIGVWVVTNRVIIFGFFNFEGSLSLNSRISWVHEKLESFKFPFLNFYGFYATVIYSIIIGYLIMAAFNILSGIGKALYKLSNKVSISLLQKVDSPNWIEKEDWEKEQSRANNLEKELDTKKSEYRNLQTSFDSNLNQVSGLNIKIKELGIEKVEFLKIIEEQKVDLNNYKSKDKNFIINYARYGKSEKSIEVTKIASDNLLSTGELIINNETFNFDPYENEIKELFIQFSVNGKTETITAIEGEKLEFKDNKIIIIKTIESKI